VATLSLVTNQDYGMNQDDWKSWWANEQGYVYERPPATPEVEPEFKPVVNTWVHFSCFGAGTPVLSLGGPKPIESIQVGDRVLVQDTKDGQLSYQPVLAVYHNKPSATLRVTLDDDAVVATGIHRFWKAGAGWVMARDLKAGDVLRTVGGRARVGSVEPASERPVFNLEVGSGQSYFVGNAGVLVHDNSIVQPVTQAFDAEPTVTTLAPGRQSLAR
jgi:hypothetical protein